MCGALYSVNGMQRARKEKKISGDGGQVVRASNQLPAKLTQIHPIHPSSTPDSQIASSTLRSRSSWKPHSELTNLKTPTRLRKTFASPKPSGKRSIRTVNECDRQIRHLTHKIRNPSVISREGVLFMGAQSILPSHGLYLTKCKQNSMQCTRIWVYGESFWNPSPQR